MTHTNIKTYPHMHPYLEIISPCWLLYFAFTSLIALVYSYYSNMYRCLEDVIDHTLPERTRSLIHFGTVLC